MLTLGPLDYRLFLSGIILPWFLPSYHAGLVIFIYLFSVLIFNNNNEYHLRAYFA